MPPEWYVVLVDNFHYLYFGIFVKSLAVLKIKVIQSPLN